MFAKALLGFVLCSGAAAAFPAAIGDIESGGSLPVPELKRGAALDVPCPKIDQAKADTVTVVMYPGRDDTSSGVGGVLVTERTIAPGVVHVRLPDIPDLKDHVVRVKVFWPLAGGQHLCDGGRIRLL